MSDDDTFRKLMLTPLLDADLIELLRKVLQNNPDSKAVLELIAKLTSASFANDKRLAIIKILSKAFERGNSGAELVLSKTLDQITNRPALQNVKRSVLDAVTQASSYTAQFYNIIQPKFNPQPRPRFIPKTGGNDRNED